MKYILITILFFNLFIIDVKKEKELKTANLNTVNIKIIDIDTKEELCAVKNIDKYSNYEGEIKINKGDSILLELISYEKVNINSVKKDTIIEMSRLK